MPAKKVIVPSPKPKTLSKKPHWATPMAVTRCQPVRRCGQTIEQISPSGNPVNTASFSSLTWIFTAGSLIPDRPRKFHDTFRKGWMGV